MNEKFMDQLRRYEEAENIPREMAKWWQNFRAAPRGLTRQQRKNWRGCRHFCGIVLAAMKRKEGA